MIRNAIIGVALIAGVAGFVISMMHKSSDIAFIDMGRIYSEFSLAKELNAQQEKVFKARRAVVDSMYNDLRLQTEALKQRERKPSEQEVNMIAKLEENLYLKRDQLEQDNKVIIAENDAKIWNQINQYIKDYGNAKQLTYILGASGQGNIMFAQEARNITGDVITYINNRYNGLTNK